MDDERIYHLTLVHFRKDQAVFLEGLSLTGAPVSKDVTRKWLIPIANTLSNVFHAYVVPTEMHITNGLLRKHGLCPADMMWWEDAIAILDAEESRTIPFKEQLRHTCDKCKEMED